MKIRYLIAFALILIVWTFVCEWYHCRYDTPSVLPDTVYVEKIEEVKDTAPDIKDEKVIGQVTFPVLSNSLNTGKIKIVENTLFEQNRENKTDSTCLFEQKYQNKQKEVDSATLLVVQRKYTDDSTYTAYVSGVKIDSFPRLDSITVRQKTLERTINNTIYKDKHGLRFKIRPAAGGGYDPLNKQWGVYVGGAVILDW